MLWSNQNGRIGMNNPSLYFFEKKSKNQKLIK